MTFGGSDGRRPIFWGETEADENYVLCDGGSDGFGGNVPDLRGRMILGASETYPEGTKGGSERHEHDLSGTVGETTITVAQMANHNHVQSFANGWGEGQDGTVRMHVASYAGSTRTQSTGQSQSHTHSFAASTGEVNNLPPFYSLAIIMRVA